MRVKKIKTDAEVKKEIQGIINACNPKPTSKQKKEIEDCFYEMREQDKHYNDLIKKTRKLKGRLN